MAVVDFTTIPCEPKTANRHMESQILCEIRPCANKKFELLDTFL